jgi:hypothetical protein
MGGLKEMICHHCGNELKVGRFISRSDECPKCASDVRCCLNCANYDPYAHNKCREPQAEWVTDRGRANFCDFFIPNSLNPVVRKDRAPDPRTAFDNLFKK